MTNAEPRRGEIVANVTVIVTSNSMGQFTFSADPNYTGARDPEHERAEIRTHLAEITARVYSVYGIEP